MERISILSALQGKAGPREDMVFRTLDHVSSSSLFQQVYGFKVRGKSITYCAGNVHGVELDWVAH